MKLFTLGLTVLLSVCGPLVAAEEKGFDAAYNLTSLAAGVDCGVKNTDNLGMIVGGIETRPHAYPWAIAMKRYGRFICGGTLISENYVLTAAHCVKSNGYVVPASSLSVVVGAHDINTSGQTIQVERVIAHANYDENYMQNDIALLRLRRSIDFKAAGNTIRPVCLPTPDMDKINFVGKQSTIVGWGTTSEGGRVAQRLREVQVPIISNDECASMYSPSQIRQYQICAAYRQGGKDSCQGDSGGSLTLPQLATGKYYQLGVVSWGAGCARPNAPGVYTRVTKFIGWINSNAR